MTVENGLPIPSASRYYYGEWSVNKIPSCDSCESKCLECVGPSLSDKLNLIDVAYAASWGTERRLRKEVNEGEAREWGACVRYGVRRTRKAWRWGARDRRSTCSESPSTFAACHVCWPWQQSIWGPCGTKRVLKPNQKRLGKGKKKKRQDARVQPASTCVQFTSAWPVQTS